MDIFISLLDLGTITAVSGPHHLPKILGKLFCLRVVLVDRIIIRHILQHRRIIPLHQAAPRRCPLPPRKRLELGPRLERQQPPRVAQPQRKGQLFPHLVEPLRVARALLPDVVDGDLRQRVVAPVDLAAAPAHVGAATAALGPVPPHGRVDGLQLGLGRDGVDEGVAVQRQRHHDARTRRVQAAGDHVAVDGVELRARHGPHRLPQLRRRLLRDHRLQPRPEHRQRVLLPQLDAGQRRGVPHKGAGELVAHAQEVQEGEQAQDDQGRVLAVQEGAVLVEDAVQEVEAGRQVLPASQLGGREQEFLVPARHRLGVEAEVLGGEVPRPRLEARVGVACHGLQRRFDPSQVAAYRSRRRGQLRRGQQSGSLARRGLPQPEGRLVQELPDPVRIEVAMAWIQRSFGWRLPLPHLCRLHVLSDAPPL